MEYLVKIIRRLYRDIFPGRLWSVLPVYPLFPVKALL